MASCRACDLPLPEGGEGDVCPRCAGILARLHPALRASAYIPPEAGPVDWSRVFGGDIEGVRRDILRLGADALAHEQPST